MSEMLLVAIFAGATEGTTSMVLAHRRRHLLSAGVVPSPRIAAASCSHSQPGPTSYAMASRAAAITQLARSARCSRRWGRSLTGGDVLGYLRGTLRLGFGLSRWDDGAWITVDPSNCLDSWAVQSWFTEPSSQAPTALAI
jgi:hypothetical protein